MEAAQQKAQQLIDGNAVMVFSKSYCPYCRNTKRILDNHNAKYGHYELDQEGKPSKPLGESGSGTALTRPWLLQKTGASCRTPWSS